MGNKLLHYCFFFSSTAYLEKLTESKYMIQNDLSYLILTSAELPVVNKTISLYFLVVLFFSISTLASKLLKVN